MSRFKLLTPIAIAALCGCIRVGAVPGLTFTSAVPMSRPGAELSVAIAPGYYVSDAVADPAQRTTSALPQASILLDPAQWLADLGVSAGVRGVLAQGGYLEPLIRYRKSFGANDFVSVGAAVSGAYSSYALNNQPPLAFSMLRGSVEVGGEVRVSPPTWIEARLLAGGGTSALSAQGTYCATAAGSVTDCPTTTPAAQHVTGTVRGAFWSGYGGLAVDIARPLKGPFHFARLAGVVAMGDRPTVQPLAPVTPGPTPIDVVAVPGPRAFWSYWGASVTIALGMPQAKPASP